MDDIKLERLALITIIIGLVLANYFVFNGEKIDGFYVDEGLITLKGSVQDIRVGEEWSYVKLNACREIEGFYQGNLKISKNDLVVVEGDFDDQILNIRYYFLE